MIDGEVDLICAVLHAGGLDKDGLAIIYFRWFTFD